MPLSCGMAKPAGPLMVRPLPYLLFGNSCAHALPLQAEMIMVLPSPAQKTRPSTTSLPYAASLNGALTSLSLRPLMNHGNQLRLARTVKQPMRHTGVS